MATVIARAYLSPTLVLLAMDWPDGVNRLDFLGFAIRRTPGFLDLSTGLVAPSSFLPNRVSFNGPPAAGQPDFPSNVAPIQKFMWWDARLDGSTAGDSLTYEITPVCGTPAANQMITADTFSLTVVLSPHIEFGIGTWFNRAVMSRRHFRANCDHSMLPRDNSPPHRRSNCANGSRTAWRRLCRTSLTGRAGIRLGGRCHLSPHRQNMDHACTTDRDGQQSGRPRVRCR